MTYYGEAYLYVLVAPAFGASMCFKIGISADFWKRRKEVQTGCPFPIKEILHVKMRSMSDARDAERYLHDRLKAYKSSGEWFLFDTSDKTHKADFGAATKAVLSPMLGSAWKWTRVRVQVEEASIRIAKKVPRKPSNMRGAEAPGKWSIAFG